MAEPGAYSTVEPPPEPPPSARSAGAWIVGVVLGVLFILVAIPVALTATPRQCASCHEMKPYFDSWQASSHVGVAPNCLVCHVKPGVLNVVGYELGFYREIVGHFTGAAITTSGANAPSVQSCRQPSCHSLNREVSTSGDLKINHRLHVADENIPCMRCHPGAVHEGVGGRTKLPPMKLCKECHAAKMSDCGYCHTDPSIKSAPGVH